MNDDIERRLAQHLSVAVSRLDRMGGAVAVVDDPALGDPLDVMQASETRELGFATRELLLERVNRLSEALDRLRCGEYGTCARCGQPISWARLHALPEVQTCVACQSRLERRLRPAGRHRLGDEPFDFSSLSEMPVDGMASAENPWRRPTAGDCAGQ